MATLIAVYNSDGCVGRCDAKCHDAQTADCDCICGGLNHGAGLEKARENTCEHFTGEKSLADFAEKHGLDPRGLKLDAQGDLFPWGNEPTTRELKRAHRKKRKSKGKEDAPHVLLNSY